MSNADLARKSHSVRPVAAGQSFGDSRHGQRSLTESFKGKGRHEG
jgi:hypothetical protein